MSEAPQGAAVAADPVFTVGHSNRTWPEFIAVLAAAGVRQLVDIRRYPMSRRHPHFCRPPMERALAEAGIVYRHAPDFGGFRGDGAASAAMSSNTAWPAGFLRNYADYAQTPAYQQAVARLRAALRPGTVLMCAEKHWRECHHRGTSRGACRRCADAGGWGVEPACADGRIAPCLCGAAPAARSGILSRAREPAAHFVTQILRSANIFQKSLRTEIPLALDLPARVPTTAPGRGPRGRLHCRNTPECLALIRS
jgi:Protein of unknown function, DUF488